MKFLKRIVAALTSCVLMTLNITACRRSALSVKNDNRYKFKNIIDISGVPMKAMPNDDYEINPFSDMGAWHAYHLPGINDKEYYGGFTGPLYIAQEYGLWLSKCFNRLRIYKGNREIKLASCKSPELNYYPGLLVQKFDMKELCVELELRFVTNRTALVTTRLLNKTGTNLSLRLVWDGELLEVTNSQGNESFIPRLEAGTNGVRVTFPDIKWTWDAFTNEGTTYEVSYPFRVNTKVSGSSYNIESEIIIGARAEYVINTANTYTFTKEEHIKETEKIAKILGKPENFIKENEVRWNTYLSEGLRGISKEYEVLAVKSIETLVSNWRSPAGAIKRDGIIPSISYKWFNGMWAWDSFKQAVAVVSFEPELAKNNIRAIFDYQNTDGMIIDAIFYNRSGYKYKGEIGGNWNERNSKPPLAAWSVWKVYEATKDIAFVKELYPRLIKYHQWWYEARDNDRNGVLEYGASLDDLNNNDENIIKAAAWESGMDNAVRFDTDFGVKVLINRDGQGNEVGYSINQESVDLNSYMYAEKLYLAKLAKAIGYNEEAKIYENEAQDLKEFIKKHMFDQETGFFYDIDIESKNTLRERGKGVEGFIPLWAGLASREQATRVRDIAMDDMMFNTKVPFPTASKDNPRYKAVKYWRGPVWLDQAFFALEGLGNYSFNMEAKELAKKILENTEGSNMPGLAIRENYNPENGEGLHCTNFSWSSGMLLLICREFLCDSNKQ